MQAKDMNAITENKIELMPSIAAHRFSADLKPEHLKILADAAVVKRFESGENIFREGDPANRFYLICEGKVSLEASQGDSAPLVQFVGENEVLGWSWLFPPYYWHFSARAVTGTTAILLYGARLREECETNPAFGYELMKRIVAVVVKRLQITRTQCLQLQQVLDRGN